MNEDQEIKGLRERFKLVRRKCGGEDVVINKDDPCDYGGETGRQSGSLQIGCNGCKNNDWYLWL